MMQTSGSYRCSCDEKQSIHHQHAFTTLPKTLKRLFERWFLYRDDAAGPYYPLIDKQDIDPKHTVRSGETFNVKSTITIK